MNFLELAKTIAAKGAPLLGSVIAGAPGEYVGELVAKAFGGDINDPKTLMTAINADPDASTKLAQIEANEKVELERILVEGKTKEIQSDVENTANARDFNVKTHSYFPQFLSTLIVTGFFLCIYWIAFFKQESQDHDIMYMMLGIIGTSFGAVVNFWLGSSADKGTFNKK